MLQVMGQGIVNEAKVAGNRVTTVTAADVITIVGMRVVLSVVVSLETDPADTGSWVSAVPGLTTNTFTLKTWQNTSGSDPTPAAATSFGQVVNYIAFGY